MSSMDIVDSYMKVAHMEWFQMHGYNEINEWCERENQISIWM